MADFNPQERVKKMVNAIKNEVYYVGRWCRLERNSKISWIMRHNNSRLRRTN